MGQVRHRLVAHSLALRRAPSQLTPPRLGRPPFADHPRALHRARAQDVQELLRARKAGLLLGYAREKAGSAAGGGALERRELTVRLSGWGLQGRSSTGLSTTS